MKGIARVVNQKFCNLIGTKASIVVFQKINWVPLCANLGFTNKIHR